MSSDSQMTVINPPAHVPADHIVDFDYLHPAGIEEGDVYTALKRLHDGPDIVWTPHNGGHWIVTRVDDVRWVQENYQIFSHEIFSIPRERDAVKMPPLTVDPPKHARYRAVLNPAFTISQVREISESARALTIDLIEELKPKGTCEFVNEFARVMPVAMFLRIVDLPLERRREFVEWGAGFMEAIIPGERERYLKPVAEYLKEVLDERGDRPGADLLSRIAAWRQHPRFGGEHEVIGMALLVFFGGLDTVASMLSFTVRHLATHPELRRRLIDDPAIIPRAAEELIRRFGLSNTGRLILSDVERKGVIMRAGEMVMVSNGLSSLDERAYPNPFEVDVDRPELFDAKGQPAHNTFGNGPHKCVGAPLARAELCIFLQEWLPRIPDFRLDPERPAKTHANSVNGVRNLHLLWDT